MNFEIGDKIISKKTHPCGGNVWTITRVGADIKIKCDKCGHVVMIDRVAFEKIVKKKLENDSDEKKK